MVRGKSGWPAQAWLLHACSTGWITHYGEKMANTSAEELASALAAVLHYGNGTGSVNLYMAHGGSNWGFWAGQAAGNLNHAFVCNISSSVSVAF